MLYIGTLHPLIPFSVLTVTTNFYDIATFEICKLEGSPLWNMFCSDIFITSGFSRFSNTNVPNFKQQFWVKLCFFLPQTTITDSHFLCHTEFTTETYTFTLGSYSGCLKWWMSLHNALTCDFNSSISRLANKIFENFFTFPDQYQNLLLSFLF
jgi:hypothetical protein